MLNGASARDHLNLRDNISLAFTKGMYLNGVPDTTLVSPDTWLIDQTLLDRPGADEIALALLADYPTNLTLYPDFQKYLRTPGYPCWPSGAATTRSSSPTAPAPSPPTCPTPKSTFSTPATSPWRPTWTPSPATSAASSAAS
ncbi:MAG: hypothetical protein ACJ72W_01695 [Actinoallomurus sp.]